MTEENLQAAVKKFEELVREQSARSDCIKAEKEFWILTVWIKLLSVFAAATASVRLLPRNRQECWNICSQMKLKMAKSSSVRLTG